MYRSTALTDALWWPSTKIAGRYLSPFLASLVNVDEVATAAATGSGERHEREER